MFSFIEQEFRLFWTSSRARLSDMKCVVKTRQKANACDVWQAVKRSDTLIRVTRGFLRFRDAGKFPEIWEEGVKVDTGFVFFSCPACMVGSYDGSQTG